MGTILKFARDQKDLFDPVKRVFYDLPANQTQSVTSALISPGKVAVNQSVAQMSGNQLAALISKIDSIYRSDVSNPIANMIAEEIRSAIIMVRITAQAAAGSAEFAGILASGQQLDVWPLRPKDVGGVYLNGAGTGAKGLYGGTSAGVFTWYQAGLVAGTVAHIIPTQTTSGQSPYGGLVIFGAVEKTYDPKIESISLVLQGQPSGTVPAQPCAMTAKRTFGEDNDLSIFRLEKPVIITYNESFGVDIMPNISGSTNFELIALMCGQVQNKVL
jgi:hypothetical protein